MFQDTFLFVFKSDASSFVCENYLILIFFLHMTLLWNTHRSIQQQTLMSCRGVKVRFDNKWSSSHIAKVAKVSEIPQAKLGNKM